MPPGHAGDEEHRSERRQVDERRAEVGLGEDEHDRHEPEPDDPESRPPRAVGALPLDQHPREGEDEQELSELRRLEGEEPKADPARRPVGRVPDEQDERDDDGGADEDPAPVATVEIRIDEGRGDEHDASHARVEDLAVEVVARIVRQRELRYARDSPEPDDDERRHTDQQEPVEGADDGEQARRVALGAKPCPL